MKTYLKTLLRAFKKHITRFVSIVFIVLVSVGFVSGIGTSTEKLKFSLSEYYEKQNVSDLIVKSTASDGLSMGFSAEEIVAAKEVYGEENLETGASIDVYIGVNGETQLIRLYFLDNFENPSVNKYEVLERAELAKEEDFNIAYAEVSDNMLKGFELRSGIELDFKDILEQLAKQGGQEIPSYLQSFLNRLTPVKVTVGATIKSPLTFANDGEPSWLNPEDTKIPDTINEVNNLITLDNVLFLPSSLIPEIFGVKVLQTTDVYLSFPDRTQFKALNDEYKTYVESQKALFSEKSGADAETLRFITLNDNYSFVSLISYANKVSGIGLVLMVAFLFVTALVVLSNMTRLMEEEPPLSLESSV